VISEPDYSIETAGTANEFGKVWNGLKEKAPFAMFRNGRETSMTEKYKRMSYFDLPQQRKMSYDNRQHAAAGERHGPHSDLSFASFFSGNVKKLHRASGMDGNLE